MQIRLQVQIPGRPYPHRRDWRDVARRRRRQESASGAHCPRGELCRRGCAKGPSVTEGRSGPHVQCYLLHNHYYQYPFPTADEYLRQLAAENPEKPKAIPTANSIVIGEPEQEMDVEMSAPTPQPTLQESAPPKSTVDEIIEKRTGDPATPTSQVDTPDVRVRFPEKKRLHWKGKTCALFLKPQSNLISHVRRRPCAINDSRKPCTQLLPYALPLSLFANDVFQPFRRMCVDLGADITCGESS